ncbi:hypothetical protein ACI789_04505 [Geodermatophilus sp. SYSU D00965]
MGTPIHSGRRSSRRRRTFGPTVLAVAVLAAACTSEPVEPPPSTGGVEDPALPFAADSPWNSPIPEDPRLDQASDDMATALLEDGGAVALLYDYGVPVYEVDAGTPSVAVDCTQTGWGECPLETEPVRVPDGASPSAGSDGAMVVIDRATGRVYDFWQARQTGSGWEASWGTWAGVDSDGIGGEAGGATGGATGAGINLLAGLTRTAEIEEGRIPHALAIVSDKSCPEVYRYPATKTDGHADSLPCIPQGARIQLDPSIDVSAIPDITPGERAVARALQEYGAYVRDSSQVSMGIVFEVPTSGEDPYQEVAGFPWDYYDMPHIPWERIRVLASWDGS